MAGDEGGKMSESSVIVLDKMMIKFPVWLSLSGTAVKVYCLFRCKCQIEKKDKRFNKRSKTLIERILNNGEIEFCYIEARDKYGITASRFSRAIDELIRKGFLYIEQVGGGVHKLKTLYGIDERWKDYGTPAFKEVQRPERRFKCGFRKGNRLWQKKKSTVIFAHGKPKAMRNNAHGSILAMHNNAHGEKVKNQYKFNNGRYLCSQIA